jgi:hypothetical protein
MQSQPEKNGGPDEHGDQASIRHAMESIPV